MTDPIWSLTKLTIHNNFNVNDLMVVYLNRCFSHIESVSIADFHEQSSSKVMLSCGESGGYLGTEYSCFSGLMQKISTTNTPHSLSVLCCPNFDIYAAISFCMTGNNLTSLHVNQCHTMSVSLIALIINNTLCLFFILEYVLF